MRYKEVVGNGAHMLRCQFGPWGFSRHVRVGFFGMWRSIFQYPKSHPGFRTRFGIHGSLTLRCNYFPAWSNLITRSLAQRSHKSVQHAGPLVFIFFWLPFLLTITVLSVPRRGCHFLVAQPAQTLVVFRSGAGSSHDACGQLAYPRKTKIHPSSQPFQSRVANEPCE